MTLIMKTVALPLLEVAGIAVTRGMVGAGIALLVGEHLSRQERRSLGKLLFIVGLITTVPFVYDLFVRRPGVKGR